MKEREEEQALLCENCGKRTALKYVRIADGKEVELRLCPACYAKLYPEREEEDFFTAFLGNVSGDRAKACPACGTTLGKLRKTGLVGCAECYEAFREELLPALRYIQWDLRHRGKSPSGDAESKYDLVRGLVNEREKLRGELSEAILSGGYDRAEALKKRLREVNRKLSDTEDV